ncbi:hypothetical protein DL89DRAFT_113870 [Linderina pennispora]|uniref:Uncharacterized protein n=1 Tax=Linderina pennispora TaxID=61395 RepID=A0A1Y1WH02_9FUNG|nr:uncharacterized protein DL89DRAFT_113870 [Linderina pennispora]ORX72516.1 hypothetical protein DL89DRAFT_113870 [Linderina pennispora]
MTRMSCKGLSATRRAEATTCPVCFHPSSTCAFLCFTAFVSRGVPERGSTVAADIVSNGNYLSERHAAVERRLKVVWRYGWQG